MKEIKPKYIKNMGNFIQIPCELNEILQIGTEPDIVTGEMLPIYERNLIEIFYINSDTVPEDKHELIENVIIEMCIENGWNREDFVN